MSNYRVRKKRSLNRLKQKRRRDVAFFLEQRVKALEAQKVVDQVDSEQIHDLLNQLEIKVHRLSDMKREWMVKMKDEKPKSALAKFMDWLCEMGMWAVGLTVACLFCVVFALLLEMAK